MGEKREADVGAGSVFAFGIATCVLTFAASRTLAREAGVECVTRMRYIKMFITPLK